MCIADVTSKTRRIFRFSNIASDSPRARACYPSRPQSGFCRWADRSCRGTRPSLRPRSGTHPARRNPRRANHHRRQAESKERAPYSKRSRRRPPRSSAAAGCVPRDRAPQNQDRVHPRQWTRRQVHPLEMSDRPPPDPAVPANQQHRDPAPEKAPTQPRSLPKHRGSESSSTQIEVG